MPSVNEAYEAPEKPEDLIAWCEKKRTAGKARMPLRQMKMNLAFFLGEQWLVWDGERKVFAKPRQRTDDPNAPVRITANKIGALVERYVARLLKANLEPEALPVTDNDSDVDAAKVGTRILASELHRLDWDTQEVDLYFWVAPLGFSYMQVAWDPGSGPVVGQDEKGNPVPQGEITLDVVPGPELAVDPAGKKRDLSDSLWACRTIAMTPEAVWERWGVRLDGTGERTLAQEVYDLVDSAAGAREGAGSATSVMVHQMWVRPCRAVPQGMVLTYAQDRVLEHTPFPYKHGRLPFVQFNLFPGVGSREGRTWVKDAIPLQADYNDARSREATIRRTLVPKVIAPTGSIDASRLTSRVEVISFNPVGSAPQWLLPDSRWMTQYEAGMNRADAELTDRAGEEDAQFGTRTPAASILAIQEMGDTKLGIPARQHAVGVEQVGWLILELVRQFWMEERVTRTWSEDGDLATEHFRGADVSAQLDVRVKAQSSLPKSKAARVQLAMELMTLPSIAAHMDPRSFFQMLDVPGTDFIVASINLDNKEAEYENSVLAGGQPVEVKPWQNHAIHWKVVNDFRKGEDYRKLTPEGQAIVDAHADTHMAVMQQMATAQAMGAVPHPGHELPAVTPPAPPGAPEGEEGTNARAGIGGPGQPGAVPGVEADTQAASMGN